MIWKLEVHLILQAVNCIAGDNSNKLKNLCFYIFDSVQQEMKNKD
jgi:hypothetical protein